jgi:nicotinamidase-related amidase
VKLDGVGTGDIADIEAWSAALAQTGRPIRLELSNNLSISDASTWAEYSNGWRTGGDIQCYCGSPFPLTQWSDVQSRFAQVANWAPDAGMSTRTLLLIDVQRNMLLPPEPVPGAPAVADTIAAILDRARGRGAMVIHGRNNGGADDPDAPGSTGWELIHDVAEHEAIVDKDVPDSFAGTDLGDLLADTSEIVVVGMQSQYCVRETSLAALLRGLGVVLVRGAHATYDEGAQTGVEISAAIEAELVQAGARILDPDDVTF